MELVQPLLQRNTGNPLVMKSYSALARHFGNERQVAQLLEATNAQGRLDMRILDVQYDQLIDDQEQMIHKIIDHCGLDWDERCLHFYTTDRDVHTPSYDQVRQPLYRKSVGRWKHYEHELAPFVSALGLDI